MRIPGKTRPRPPALLLSAFLWACLSTPRPALAGPPAGGGAAASSLPSAAGPWIDVRAYGADPGNTGAQNREAFQRAIDGSPRSGAVVLVPPGSYDLDNRGGYLTVANREDVHILGQGATIRCAANTGFLLLDNVATGRVSGFRITGTFSRAEHAYAGNECNGRIVLKGGRDIDIHDNRWENVAQALFSGSGTATTGVSFRNNRVYRAFAAVQFSSAGARRVDISHNVFESAPYATDDVIAAFSGPSDSIHIDGNIIDRNGGHGEMLARAIDISSGRADTAIGNVVISNNTIVNGYTGNPAGGRGAIVILGGGSTDNVIAGNVTITGNTIDEAISGIDIGYGVRNVTVTGNAFRNVTRVPGNANGPGSGVWTSSGPPRTTNLTLSGNTFDNCHRGISLTNGANAVVIGNVVTNSVAQGILVDATDNVTLVGNSVSGSGSQGIRLNNVDNAVVVGNRSWSNASASLHVSGASSAGIAAGNLFDSVTNGATASRWRFLENSTGTAGIGGTGTPARNLRGSATFASSGTVVVSFPENEENASYHVVLGCDSATQRFGWGAKGVGGFTIHSDDPASTARCDWILVR